MKDIPVIILCGGTGIYVDTSGQRKNKSLIEVAGEPMVAHVMRMYHRAGARRFVLAGGYQLEALAAAGQKLRSTLQCEVEVVDTGLETRTGGRLKRAAARLGQAPLFCLTYSDTVAALDPAQVVEAHRQDGKLATLVAARIPTRFRILGLRATERQVRGFASRPVIRNEWINGGFYVFDRKVLDNPAFAAGDATVLEEAVLESLVQAGELMSFPHEGEWHYLDSERDLAAIERVVRELRAR